MRAREETPTRALERMRARGECEASPEHTNKPARVRERMREQARERENEATRERKQQARTRESETTGARTNQQIRTRARRQTSAHARVKTQQRASTRSNRHVRARGGDSSEAKRGRALLRLALAGALCFACADSEGARVANAGQASADESAASEWPRAVLLVGLQRLRVEIADTPARSRQGLSGRARLPASAGMYFPFDPPARRSFWMKDMRFDIDILWILDGRVVEISARVPHGPGPASRAQPTRAVDAALEVRAGSAERWGWQPGTPVAFESHADTPAETPAEARAEKTLTP